MTCLYWGNISAWDKRDLGTWFLCSALLLASHVTTATHLTALCLSLLLQQNLSDMSSLWRGLWDLRMKDPRKHWLFIFYNFPAVNGSSFGQEIRQTHSGISGRFGTQMFQGEVTSALQALLKPTPFWTKRSFSISQSAALSSRGGERGTPELLSSSTLALAASCAV